MKKKTKKIIVLCLCGALVVGMTLWVAIYTAVQYHNISSDYLKQKETLTLSPEEWEITFEDNFDFFDHSKWQIDTYIREKNPSHSGVRRVAYYTADEDIIFTQDGNLHIRTKWKDGKYGAGWYSGFMSTKSELKKHNVMSEDYQGFAQVGGYFECRCKVSEAEGIWSAFWMMPDIPHPFSKEDIQFSGEDGIEVDIMESPHAYRRTKRERNQNIHVIHADGYDSRLKSLKSQALYVPNMYDEFHTYGFMWDEDKYTFYIDGIKTWETKHIYDGQDMGICKTPEYIILSTEVAGEIKDGQRYPGLTKNGEGEWVEYWCGNPDTNDKTKNYDFVVDYVKCYKKK